MADPIPESSETPVPEEKRPQKPGHQEKRLMRSAARLGAVQALYQMEMTGMGWRSAQLEFEAHRLGRVVDEAEYRMPDLGLFREILRGVVERQGELDRLIDGVLAKEWPIARIDPILRAVFRGAAYELTARADVPARAAIVEYVDVARAFFDQGEESRFANGVLDGLARQLRPGEF
ncbi:transcription antitermination factor NusB [Neomegalonema perideroedes]|uniref:transcription antitermination factor NusB n=1 Tax=Neomegalonema perideroedes TaxID=217219 RepID=UPI00035E4984|nr:transcription antitermination factor NusB [Neomegalonema perideroedes]